MAIGYTSQSVYEQDRVGEDGSTQAASWARLKGAIRKARRDLETFRELRLMLLGDYVGKYYGDRKFKDRIPANFIELFVNIYRRQLASQAPACTITTKLRPFRATAFELQLALNKLLKDIDFGQTLEMLAIDALLNVGIVKVGVSAYATVEVEGFLHDVNQPFADWVNLDDFVVDMDAERYERIGFVGDRIRVPLDLIQQSRRFAGVDWKPGRKLRYSETGEERASFLSRSTGEYEEESEDYVEYWELWLPRTNQIVCFEADEEGLPKGEPIEIKEWEGPERGPYRLLPFVPVPSNLMPASAVGNVYDLHEAANIIYRKIMRQAQRQKKVAGVRSGRPDDGNQVLKAEDGQMVKLDDPRNVTELSLGGFDERNMAFFIHAQRLFSYFSGNLDLLGGLSPQSETLGQDRLLAASSSRRLSDMQETMVRFVTGVCEDLLWWMWNDPLTEMSLVKEVPGTKVSIPFTWSQERRRGNLADYELRIEPYSLIQKSPAQKLNEILALFQQVIAPLLGPLQASGVFFDFQAFIKTVVSLADLPELDGLFVYLGESAGQTIQPSAPPGTNPKPAMTTRRYERVNRPGATREGADEAMMATMLGMANSPMQGSQQRAMFRSTG
jgi:hypothetical protein